MSKALRVFAVSLLVLVAEVPASAFCVCVRGMLKVAEVRGQVVATYRHRPGVEEPIAKASVKVRRCDAGECQTVAEATTDERGRFTVGSVKPGRYELEVSAAHFERVAVGLKVSGGPGGRKEEIVMRLEAGIDCCSGRAEVRKYK